MIIYVIYGLRLAKRGAFSLTAAFSSLTCNVPSSMKTTWRITHPPTKPAQAQHPHNTKSTAPNVNTGTSSKNTLVLNHLHVTS